MADEETLITSRRGKWAYAPGSGWYCVGMEDLGKPDAVCQMCESQKIRYVHRMKHDDYLEILAVGCVCAGHMGGDLDAARAREASMKGRGSKRKKWASRVWRVSSKGNFFLIDEGFRATIYPRGYEWGVTVASMVDSSVVKHSRCNYKNMDESKLAAFDLISSLGHS